MLGEVRRLWEIDRRIRIRELNAVLRNASSIREPRALYNVRGLIRGV